MIKRERSFIVKERVELIPLIKIPDCKLLINKINQRQIKMMIFIITAPWTTKTIK